MKYTALIDPQRVHIPQLHIKRDLMKEFDKGMEHESSGFQKLKDKFKRTSTDAKLEDGVFIGSVVSSMTHHFHLIEMKIN